METCVHFCVNEFKESVATFEENCTVVVLSLLQRASEGFGTPLNFYFFFHVRGRVAWNRRGVVVFRSLCWMMIFWKRESIGVGFRVLEP
jgi:hypothetical protein